MTGIPFTLEPAKELRAALDMLREAGYRARPGNRQAQPGPGQAQTRGRADDQVVALVHGSLPNGCYTLAEPFVADAGLAKKRRRLGGHLLRA